MLRAASPGVRSSSPSPTPAPTLRNRTSLRTSSPCSATAQLGARAHNSTCRAPEILIPAVHICHPHTAADILEFALGGSHRTRRATNPNLWCTRRGGVCALAALGWAVFSLSLSIPNERQHCTASSHRAHRVERLGHSCLYPVATARVAQPIDLPHASAQHAFSQGGHWLQKFSQGGQW